MKTREELLQEAASLGMDLDYTPDVALKDIMEAGEEEWHKSRKTGIGGSDAGAIMGLNSYSTPMATALGKVVDGGRPSITDPDDQYRLDCGHSLERDMLVWYARKLGYWVPWEDEKNPTLSAIREVRSITVDEWMEHASQGIVTVDRAQYRHPLYPFMLGDCDGIAFMPDGTKIGIECKTYGYDYKGLWKSGVYDGTPNGGQVKNAEYVVQVRHYMAVLNLDRFDLIANCGTNAEDFTVTTFYRDLKEEKKIIEMEEKFWNDLQNGIIPEEKTVTEKVFKKVRNILTAQEQSDEVIQLEKTLLEEAEEYDTINQQISELKNHIKELEKRKDGIKVKIIEALDSHKEGYIQVDDNSVFVITHKSSEKDKFNEEKFSLEHPDIYQEYQMHTVSNPTFKCTKKSAKSYFNKKTKK